MEKTTKEKYIHVRIEENFKNEVTAIAKENGLFIYNLGTGNGYSVFELVNTFSRVNNIEVPYKIVDRRPGDIAACYADVEKAKNELNWAAELGIEEMCRDAYNFVKEK